MKRCVLCRQWLDLAEFNRKRMARDGKQDVCRSCNWRVSKRYYSENRDKHLAVVSERNRRVRTALQKHLRQYFLTHQCADCGESDVEVLEFDHLRDKVANISDLISGGRTWVAVLAEIEKCDVVCANCHRRRTARRSRTVRLQLIEQRARIREGIE